MDQLPTIFSPPPRRLLNLALIAYGLALFGVCFWPQTPHSELTVPGIQQIGPFLFLLRPFNTLWALGDIQSPLQLAWVVVQNLLNIFLLYPLVLGLLFLYPRLGTRAAAVKLAFAMSLSIEITQLVLDGLIEANRVFELDDLWTNTLGGYLAYLTYVSLKKRCCDKSSAS